MTEHGKNHLEILQDQLDGLGPLEFTAPVTHVYNPLDYARAPFERYLERYGNPPREILMVGMNPGPWGMLQTGIPFGEINAVRDWLGIEGRVGAPVDPHPKRPVLGMACGRSEVSGKRLWGWARERFGTPDGFFRRFLVLNYCPLAFFDADGRNLTPDKLSAPQRNPLLDACDRALVDWVACYRPRHVIGIGRFAADRAASVLTGQPVAVGRVTHPSPANPRANKGWDRCVTAELGQMGIVI
jgi:single-strand selective monofunctional uracil DNA glycosylase